MLTSREEQADVCGARRLPACGADDVQRRVAVQPTPIALPQPGKFRKFTEPSALAFEANRPFTSIDDPSSELRDAKLNERNAGTEAGHGAGMHSTRGAVERLRFENVCEPEQPLNW